MYTTSTRMQNSAFRNEPSKSENASDINLKWGLTINDGVAQTWRFVL